MAVPPNFRLYRLPALRRNQRFLEENWGHDRSLTGNLYGTGTGTTRARVFTFPWCVSDWEILCDKSPKHFSNITLALNVLFLRYRQHKRDCNKERRSCWSTLSNPPGSARPSRSGRTCAIWSWAATLRPVHIRVVCDNRAVSYPFKAPGLWTWTLSSTTMAATDRICQLARRRPHNFCPHVADFAQQDSENEFSPPDPSAQLLNGRNNTDRHDSRRIYSATLNSVTAKYNNPANQSLYCPQLAAGSHAQGWQ